MSIFPNISIYRFLIWYLKKFGPTNILIWSHEQNLIWWTFLLANYGFNEKIWSLELTSTYTFTYKHFFSEFLLREKLIVDESLSVEIIELAAKHVLDWQNLLRHWIDVYRFTFLTHVEYKWGMEDFVGTPLGRISFFLPI